MSQPLYITRRMTPEFAGKVARAVQYTGEITEEVDMALRYANITAGYDPDDQTISIYMNGKPFWLLRPTEWIVTESGSPPLLMCLPDAAFQVTYEPLHKQVVYH